MSIMYDIIYHANYVSIILRKKHIVYYTNTHKQKLKFHRK